jgi:predicted ATPase/class 3 adenylate cyclase
VSVFDAPSFCQGSPVRDLPSGTVTFLFTDVEGSTKLLHELGSEGYADALAGHRRLIREACVRNRGVEVDTQGDAFFFAFPTAPGALAAAAEMTEELASGPIQVRIGLHTGTPLLTEEGYVGDDVHRAARIGAAGHGGQVLVSASTAQLIEIELVDLGDHRFKDLGAPERVYQLGNDEFPALKSLFRTNLPVPSTPFLGRERELAEVVGLLQGTRLLTLTGPGGTGKTRLAAQAAGLASDAYPDGVWWVPLAALRDPELVLETAAQVVGSPNGLAEHVADKRMLVLFDNFEQVVEAAGDVAGLLASCPNLDVLVTSRERLQVSAEQEYPVPPLVHEEGVGFFLSRARAIAPGFQPDDAVSEICRRVDDLPLALELAAARVKALSSAQILERLEQRLPLLTGGARDLPERQRTLRGTIEWSYELLNEEEQTLFAGLAVFRGGCTLEATEEIAEADLDTLQSLVDKSLLRFTDGRYWMLETIREYAAEKMQQSGDAQELRRRHAQHFLSLATQLEPFVPVTKEWLDEVEREHDNVRAALDGLPTQGDIELALQLAESVWRFWKMRGHQPEAQRRFETLLALEPTPTPARGHALNAAAGIAVDNGDYEVGRLFAEEALDIHREHEDAWGVARSVFMLGYAAIESGDFPSAKPLFEETVQLMVELGHEQYVGQATFNLAWACDELGDVARGKELSSDNLHRARAIGSRNLEAQALDALSGYAHDEGRFDDALAMKRDSLRILRELGDLQHTLDSLGRIASTHVRMARACLAAQLLSQQRRNEEMLELLHEQLDEAAFAEAWKYGQKLTLDEAVALALGEP